MPETCQVVSYMMTSLFWEGDVRNESNIMNLYDLSLLNAFSELAMGM